MKTLLSFICSLSFLNIANAQDSNFEQTVKFIQKKVSCCSVPFSFSTNKRVNNITIDITGNTTISYSDNSPNYYFNLYSLYKEEESKTGVDTIMKGKYIQFYINEKKAKLIKFSTKKHAKEVYTAFLEILELIQIKAKRFISFKNTVDTINALLSKWAEKGNTVSIKALNNGSIDIINKFDQHLKFNLFDLDSEADDKTKGILLSPCDVGLHVPLAWINFIQAHSTVAFIRLSCTTPKHELEFIRNTFLELKSLSIKADTLKNL